MRGTVLFFRPCILLTFLTRFGASLIHLIANHFLPGFWIQSSLDVLYTPSCINLRLS